MVNRLRLPLVIAVVVIVAMLLPGASMIAAPETPRLNGTTSFYTGPGIQLRYGVKGDAKTGMVTFVARVTNDSSDWIRNVQLKGRIPDGTTLVESFCSIPGTYPGDSDGQWVTWSRIQRQRNPEGSTSVCGFTVSGWDGKKQLVSGFQAWWDGNKNVSTWTDESGGVQKDKAVTIKWPYDADGTVKVVGVDDTFSVPTAASFSALKSDVDKLKKSAGLLSGEE